jgi:hypothetical protein
MGNFLMLLLATGGCNTGFDEGGDKVVPEGDSDTDSDADSDSDADGDSDSDADADSDADTDVDPQQSDDDGDGYSEAQGDCDDNDAAMTPQDFDGDGYSTCDGDCDDTNPKAYPGNDEDRPYDGVDADCDGSSDYDADGDGHDSANYNGGDDCDDSDDSRWDDCGRFNIETVDNCINCSGPSAIDVDTAGQPHVAYEDAGNIWYRYRTVAGAWSNYEMLDAASQTGDVLRADLGFDGKTDSSDRFQITYVAEFSGGQGLLFMFRDIGFGDCSNDDSYGTDECWSEEFLVDGPGAGSSSGGDTCEDTCSWAEDGECDDASSANFDGYDGCDAGTDCSDCGGTPSSGGSSGGDGRMVVGENVSLAIDSNDLPAFSYYVEDSNLPYIYDLSSGLVTSISDIGGINEAVDYSLEYVADMVGSTLFDLAQSYGLIGFGSGTHSSIAIDSNNNSHIVFFNDMTAMQNQYTTLPDLEGIPSAVASAATGGSSGICYGSAIDGDDLSWGLPPSGGSIPYYYNSIAIQPSGEPCVAYYDATNRDLKYACNLGGCESWSFETVDSSGDVGSHASLGIAPDGTVYIAYYDATNGDLKVAIKENGSWSYEVVDGEAGNVGIYADLAVGDDGMVHISYQDADSNSMKYASGQ